MKQISNGINMLPKLFRQIVRRKLIAVTVFVIIFGGGYLGFQGLSGNSTEVQYVTAEVQRGTVVSSISGSGQVAVSNQVLLNAKTGGDIVAVNVVSGQEVKAGARIAQIDATDAFFELESARLSLAELIDVDPLYLTQAENNLKRAEENLARSYSDAFNDLITAFSNMEDVLNSLDALYSGYFNTAGGFVAGDTGKELTADAERTYYAANRAFRDALNIYRPIARDSSESEIESVLADALDVAQYITQATKEAQSAIEYKRRRETGIKLSEANTAWLDVADLVGTIKAQVSSLSSAEEATLDAKRGLDEETLVFEDFSNGPSELSLRSEQLNVRQKEQAYYDHFIVAPFDGVVADVAVKRFGSVNSGANIATLITKQKIAEVTLNEIDVAQVEIGQLTTLTFDAVEDVTLTGKVVEIDILGTVTQGVVTYDVKIVFDTQDERIKPGMTIDASIIIDRESDVVLVPNAAIQAQGEQFFVEVMRDGIPQSVPVEIGLSNEISTEIVSGLREGAQVVTARLEGESSSQTANVSQPLRIPGFGGGGGGFRGGGFGQH